MHVARNKPTRELVAGSAPSASSGISVQEAMPTYYGEGRGHEVEARGVHMSMPPCSVLRARRITRLIQTYERANGPKCSWVEAHIPVGSSLAVAVGGAVHPATACSPHR